MPPSDYRRPARHRARKTPQFRFTVRRPLDRRLAPSALTLPENDPAECIPAHPPAQSGILGWTRPRMRLPLPAKPG